MKRILPWFIIGAALGAFAGFAAGIFVYPYVFLADIVAREQLADPGSRTVLARGSFVHANPSDPVHYGRGGVTVYDGVVHLHEDFEVGPGPAYHVYLVPEAEVTSKTSVEDTMFVDLGRLRAFRGSQVYEVPAGVVPQRYGSVVIWCEHFGVLISPATLDFER